MHNSSSCHAQLHCQADSPLWCWTKLASCKCWQAAVLLAVRQMPAFIYAHNRDHVLDQPGVETVLEQLSRLAQRHDELVCNLSEGKMTLEVLEALSSKLQSGCGSRVVALDLSYNNIRCTSWEQVEPFLDQLLGKQTVQYLDLSNNYLPALETLQQDRRLLEKFKAFGNRLSLSGFDRNPFSGDAEVDHWLSNARAFKQVAYGCRYPED